MAMPGQPNFGSNGGSGSSFAGNGMGGPSSVTGGLQGTQNQMQQFYSSMMGPINWNDPQVKSILQGAGSQAMASANASGIQGPMSINAGQQAYTDAAATMMMQRQGLGLQALQGLSGSQLGQAQVGLGQQQINLENQGQQYEENFNNTYAPWQIAAGIIGGVGGGATGLAKLGTLGGNAPPASQNALYA